MDSGYMATRAFIYFTHYKVGALIVFNSCARFKFLLQSHRLCSWAHATFTAMNKHFPYNSLSPRHFHKTNENMCPPKDR